MIVFLLLTIVVFFVLYWITRPKEHIKYYVIHLKGNEERRKNIEVMQQRLGQPIHVFDAVKGSGIDDRTFNRIRQTSDRIFNKNEVGCYLSHKDLIQMYSRDNAEYGVIFEDDFEVYPDTHEKILKLIRDFPDFDIVTIANGSDTVGYKVSPGIYNVHQTEMLSGSWGYIIRGNRIHKHLENISAPIDLKIYNHIKSGDIEGYIAFPRLVGNAGCETTLGHY
jgi:non-homologous end joining protein Ku